MNTTREDFGMIMATLARLYNGAQSRGDRRRAKAYAMAVDVLLHAWPADPEPESDSATRRSDEERTLIGLGV
jgi:hypothetical protein